MAQLNADDCPLCEHLGYVCTFCLDDMGFDVGFDQPPDTRKIWSGVLNKRGLTFREYEIEEKGDAEPAHSGISAKRRPGRYRPDKKGVHGDEDSSGAG